MSKKLSLKNDVDSVAEEMAPVLTHVALGTFRNELTGEWLVAKVRFNPETGHAEVVERIPAGPGRDFAIEKFKIVAVNEGVVG